MGMLSLLPLSPPLPLRRRSLSLVPPRLQFSIPFSSSFKLSSSRFSSPRFPRRPLPPRSSDETTSDESRFLDEDGVVQDMDGYLNYLSLEYDSVWDTKPSWCQPWTIVLTGVILIACSWVVLHSAVIRAVVISLVFTWWYIFLYSYPKAYSDMIAERRKNVTSGIEDTFGQRKS